MKTRKKSAIKRNSPQSAADDFTPEQIALWREGVARRRKELFSRNDWKNDHSATVKNSAHHRLEK